MRFRDLHLSMNQYSPKLLKTLSAPSKPTTLSTPRGTSFFGAGVRVDSRRSAATLVLRGGVTCGDVDAGAAPRPDRPRRERAGVAAEAAMRAGRRRIGAGVG